MAQEASVKVHLTVGKNERGCLCKPWMHWTVLQSVDVPLGWALESDKGRFIKTGKGRGWLCPGINTTGNAVTFRYGLSNYVPQFSC